MAKNTTPRTMPDLVPKAEFLQPDLPKNGRWSYGFADLEVGDQMRCPLKADESHDRAQNRVTSAAICWKKKNLAAQRAHIQFRSMRRSKYVLIERTA
jgi:hypothetical protein